MAQPQRPANPSKRSAPITALEQARLGIGVVTEATPQPEQERDLASDPTAVAMMQLLAQFESALRDDPAVDQAAREALQQEFGRVLIDAAAAPQPAKVPDKAAWKEAVQALQQSGIVAEADANQLIRQFDQALQPLQRRESQLAIEFSRRLQIEGQERALAWFREQTSGSPDSTGLEVPSSFSRDGAPPIRSETTNSRSRRLRGPPR